jgi:predicted dehydrogenase
MRVRVGIVGCGLIAQVMHLPYLRELHDRFEVKALCDLSPSARRFAGSWFPDARRHERWLDLLDDEVDAVLVLTPGSHADVVIAAAERGLHALAEKPLCFSAEEGQRMVAAADEASTVLMVAYMKRYDPAYERLSQWIEGGIDDIRLIRVTTLESSLEDYVAHYPLSRVRDLPASTVEELEQDDRARVVRAIGDHGELVYTAYRVGMLDSLVHELNVVRGLVGEPSAVRFAHFWQQGQGIEAALSFGEAECSLTWVQLFGIARFEQQIALYAPDRRLTLTFPSPFLRNMPTSLVEEGGEPGTASSWRREEVVGYDEAFRRELLEFHRAIIERDRPRTDGVDGTRDIALCQAFVRSFVMGAPVPEPTALAE